MESRRRLTRRRRARFREMYLHHLQQVYEEVNRLEYEAPPAPVPPPVPPPVPNHGNETAQVEAPPAQAAQAQPQPGGSGTSQDPQPSTSGEARESGGNNNPSNNDSQDSRSCPVCLEDENEILSRHGRLVSTPCRHIFCHQCIERVLHNQQRCPLCRRHLALAEIQQI